MKVKVFPIGKASFIANPDTITGGQTVTFNNTSQNSKSYNWSFGDGISSQMQTLRISIRFPLTTR